MEEKSLYILYGSQTGNAEDIAKAMHEKCVSRGYKCVLATLNSVKKASLRDLARALIIVCSTTGNGDPPENAEAFWRAIKSRTVVKDYFLDIPYSVLGLGDTNYDKFCYMGKMLDKRIAELGGQRFLPLACADEPTNLEETVELWNKSIIQSLVVIMANPTETSAAKAFEEELVSDSIDDGAVNSCTIASEPESPRCIDKLWSSRTIPEVGVVNLSQVCSLLGLDYESLSTPPDPTTLGRCKTCIADLSIASEKSPCTTSIDDDVSPGDTPIFDAKTPYLAQITHARWLTAVPECSQYHLPEGSHVTGPGAARDWGSTKRVVHMEVSLGTLAMKYSPGDSIGICCPNPARIVTKLVEILNDKPDTQPLSLQTQITWQDELLSVEDLLTYRLDLVSTVRKDAVLMLAGSCSNESEAARLRWLCCRSPLYLALWKSFVEAQGLGIVELLTLFPSCRPCLQVLASVTRPLPPRYYSIASSPLLHPASVSVAFSLVRYRCGVTDSSGAYFGTGIEREGLCTSYLEEILSPWLSAPESCSNGHHEVKLRIFLKPTVAFRLPGSLEPPLILIGPGTGVAPFVGFLQHRAQLQRSLSDCRRFCDVSEGVWRGGYEMCADELPAETVHAGLGRLHCQQCRCRGETWLFFGCRGDDDFLYQRELEGFLRDGTLTTLEVAMSRKHSEKVYVTHRLQERGKEVASLLLDKGGYVFVCGDGNGMAKDVHNALVGLLCTHGRLTRAEVEHCLCEMKARRRYVLDIWS